MKQKINQSNRDGKTVLIALVLWLLLVVVFFAPSVFNRKVIAPIDCIECVFRPTANQPIENVHNQYIADGATQYIPHKWMLQKSWKEDGYMGWNPNSFNGTACPENTMYSPGDWHNYLFAILPFWTAWDLGIIIQFYIAGCGMILLLRYYKLPIWCLLLGAVSFAFYSQFIICLYYRWLGGIIWLPFLVWCLLKYKNNIINVPAIVFMALAWRGGHMQSCVFIFFAVVLMWVSAIWKEKGELFYVKRFIRVTLSYFIVGVFGALLSLDVFVDTLPRMEGCKQLGFSWGIENIFLLPSFLFPNVYGVPQSIDTAKIIGLCIFDVKFGGAVVFILALIGCFNKKAPREAKVLFLGCLIAVMTPLYIYLYSRGTVVMALGMSWLAAWQLWDSANNCFLARVWKRLTTVFLGVGILWFVASLVIFLNRDVITEYMHNLMLKTVATVQQVGRMPWYDVRIDRFLDKILIWNWQNLVLFVCLIFGVLFCYKIAKEPSAKKYWKYGIVLITFIELCVFSYSWLSYSSIPDSQYLYKEPAWVASLRNYVKDGSVAIQRPCRDADFLLDNHLSSYGVRLAGGYETVLPKYLRPLNREKYDTVDYAQAGISHIISDIKWKDEYSPGWKLVMREKDFKLLENPDYIGRYVINDEFAIQPNWRTPNKISISLPPDCKTVSIYESYHKGWKAYVDGKPVPISQTERGGMCIRLPETLTEQSLLLEFHMPYREIYYLIMLSTFIFLIWIYIRQRKLGCLSVC